ncbi:MAG TPA: hypothetical protein VLA24_10680 [Pseudomonadales bacterium]|nr:hypothetical protein [Pseudomonadales bacterium]
MNAQNNPILSNQNYHAAFVDWATDHYKHFGYYPGSFTYYQEFGEDFEATESQVFDAIKTIFYRKEPE